MLFDQCLKYLGLAHDYGLGNIWKGKRFAFKKFLIFQEEYLKYFEWKKEYALYYTDPYCSLCQKLHNDYEPVKTYPDMSIWFYNDENDNLLCTDGSERQYFSSIIT